MFSPFERLMAFRYLRARKQEGFVSVIAGFSFVGIMLGVATLIIVMSVMNGFRQELFDRILGLNGHMNVYVPGGVIKEYEPLKIKIDDQAGIQSVTPIIEGQGLLNVGGVANGVLVRGMTSHDFLAKKVFREGIVAGDMMDFKDSSIAIGNKLAEKFRLYLGDEVVIMAPQGKSSPFGTIPRSQRFKVGLIFDVGMFEYNSGFVFMPIDTAQKFFRMPENSASYLEVLVENINNLNWIKKNLQAEIEDTISLYDWRDANSSFVNALEVERNVMFLILTLIILVAAFNIISSMIMLVKDKSSDIAIMRTIGASQRSMMKIFVLTGASIGILGTLFGALLGIAFAVNIESIRQGIEKVSGTELFSAEIYFLSQLPAQVDWGEVVYIVLMAIVLSILATLYPAWRAARLNPVEALRYE